MGASPLLKTHFSPPGKVWSAFSSSQEWGGSKEGAVPKDDSILRRFVGAAEANDCAWDPWLLALTFACVGGQERLGKKKQQQTNTP